MSDRQPSAGDEKPMPPPLQPLLTKNGSAGSTGSAGSSGTSGTGGASGMSGVGGSSGANSNSAGGPAGAGVLQIPPRADSVPPLAAASQPYQTQHSFLSAAFQQPQRGYAPNYGLPMSANKQQPMPPYTASYTPPLGPGYLPSPIPQLMLNEKSMDLHRGFQQQFPVFHAPQPHFAPTMESDSSMKKRRLLDYSDQRSEAVKDRGATKKNGNEAILRDLAMENKARPLSECALTVREAEIAVLNMDPTTHSKSEIQAAEQVRERERQVYALTWLMNTCVEEKNSFVPRGRIFAQYAACCAQNNLKPLSQATLGKLIRTIFPDLTTRRLGMRGQSKYHYCGLNLIGSSRSASPVPSLGNSDLGGVNNVQNISNVNVGVNNSSNNSLYSSIQGQGVAALSSETPSIFQESHEARSDKWEDVAHWDCLRIADELFHNVSTVDVNVSLEIPSINSYLPPNTDIDIAASLECMYKVHCNTVHENISFAKFDALTNTLESFSSGSISPQMFNLFISEALYDWVQQADLVTHKATAKSLFKFIKEFATLPSSVSEKLASFAHSYPEMISNANIDLPVPMVRNKVSIAEKFAKLVKRTTRVIRTAKSASKAYRTATSREEMYMDWKKLIKVKDICRTELYCCRNDEASLNEITSFIIQMIEGFFDRDEHSISEDFPMELAAQLLTFLKKIRDHPVSVVIACTNVVTTGVIRELSIMGSEHAGSWWAIKTFIDEWLYWCDEVGTFMISPL
ncbi:Rfx1p [Lachancea thermotolerans CBS 6340]|uniref:KLTH0H12144p n=1 Tax=Lachancea thermotolerans (strain ATCC 56472 / CBS 6340 / NRRL Y-8284) TaxID=559295 RepID=C5E3C2_LACTC|nr:KLTH0H12144p [Lachancea thermotolerans CBS 6340]CAR30533.1 KLTH0H12144p [Lachancea thermotolerans CBS 6340]